MKQTSLERLMYKKVNLWIVLLLIIFFIIFSIYFGYSVYKKQSQTLTSIARIPEFIKRSFEVSFDPGADLKSHDQIHSKKEKFKRYRFKKRDEILILSRYDPDINRSVVELIDLNTFKVLHKYLPDIKLINGSVDTKKIEFEKHNIRHSPQRAVINHPLILSDGSLIASSDYALLYKIDFCSRLEWVNKENLFHHSKNLDSNNNIVAISNLYPYSKGVSHYSEYFDKYIFRDDAITILNQSGEKLYEKSITEILLENNLIGYNELKTKNFDPIHTNDIEPVKKDTKYWKKDDLFISIRNLNMILLYRPSNNKILKIFKGNFNMQHDVDIYSESEITIFNNNWKFSQDGEKDENNIEILVYNFEDNKYRNLYETSVRENNIKTSIQGLVDFFEDGSAIIEEEIAGRLLLINNKNEIEWEYINKNRNNSVYTLNWSRLLKDKEKIKKIKKIISKRKCF